MSKEEQKDEYSWLSKISNLKIPVFTILIGFLVFYSALTGLRTVVPNSTSFIPTNLHIPLWIFFFVVTILTIFILIGGGIKSFFFEKQLMTSKRHLLLFTISISIFVNYKTMGNHFVSLEGDIFSDMFDILFCLSELSLVILVIILIRSFYLEIKNNKERKDDKKNSILLVTDNPLQTSEKDVLNRKKFAKELINPIIKSNGKLTIGVYGLGVLGNLHFSQ